MKHILPYCLSLLACVNATGVAVAQTVEPQEEQAMPDSLLSDPVALFESLPQPEINPEILDLSLIPKVFSGYQKILETPTFDWNDKGYNLNAMLPPDELATSPEVEDSVGDSVLLNDMEAENEESQIEEDAQLPYIQKYKTPKWLKDAVTRSRFQENTIYSYMIDNPMSIEYAYWDLPLPPVLLQEDHSFLAFIRKQDVPDVDPEDAVLPETEVKKKHWLHTLNTLLQFSQAYVSPNWYQGGNSYLSLLFGFNWKVELNQVYHPNILFVSDLQYKLAINSNPKNSFHHYTIAEDNFQYNLNTGLKAAKDWYYSLNLQFKTQLFNNYETDSPQQTAAILSPGDLNVGLGMSYSHKNKVNTFSYTLTISPLSYNLKTCLAPNSKILHSTYGIPDDKKVKNEIGSNVEFVMDWKICANISYKTRLFMFTNYSYFLADWQNTINFEINKFLSTQVFVHLRYDGSTESYEPHWKKFMLREILSFGLSYTFTTVP